MKEKQSHAEKTKIGLADACFSSIKSAIGLGLLFLPGGLSKTGLAGLLFIVLFGVISSITLYLCTRSLTAVQKFDYFSLGEEIFGATGKWLCFIFLGNNLVCVCAVFSGFMMKFLGQIIHLVFFKLLGLSGATNEDSFIIKAIAFISIVVITIAISSLRNTKIISKFAALGFAAITFILGVLFLDFVRSKNKIFEESSKVTPDFQGYGKFALSIVFAFANHFTYMSAIKDLKSPTPARQNKTIIIAGFVETLFYSFFAFFGYIALGQAAFIVNGKDGADILTAGIKHHEGENGSMLMYVLYNLSSFMILSACIFTYPLLIGPLREMLISAMPEKYHKGSAEKRLFHILNVSICSLSAIIPGLVTLEKLDEIAGFAAGINGSFLFFFFPAAIFIATQKPFRRFALLDMLFTLAALAIGAGIFCFFILNNIKKEPLSK